MAWHLAMSGGLQPRKGASSGSVFVGRNITQTGIVQTWSLYNHYIQSQGCTIMLAIMHMVKE